jgi:CHAT domain-containing protein
VFGLRRGFQEAGAQSLLMSLWSVPEPETAELMKNFYHNWLTLEGDADKHLALQRAQLALRETVRTEHGGLTMYRKIFGVFALVLFSVLTAEVQAHKKTNIREDLRGVVVAHLSVSLNGRPAPLPRSVGRYPNG